MVQKCYQKRTTPEPNNKATSVLCHGNHANDSQRRTTPEPKTAKPVLLCAVVPCLDVMAGSVPKNEPPLEQGTTSASAVVQWLHAIGCQVGTLLEACNKKNEQPGEHALRQARATPVVNEATSCNATPCLAKRGDAFNVSPAYNKQIRKKKHQTTPSIVDRKMEGGRLRLPQGDMDELHQLHQEDNQAKARRSQHL